MTSTHTLIIAARAALEEGRRQEAGRLLARAVRQEPENYRIWLLLAGLAPTPSVTNFLLCRVGSPSEADRLNEALLRGGIVVRTFGPDSPLAGYLRFTVRDREQNERFLQVIEAWSAGRSA